jgi:hypothetical protein
MTLLIASLPDRTTPMFQNWLTRALQTELVGRDTTA